MPGTPGDSAETRLISAQLLHGMLHFLHGNFDKVPFMEAVQSIVILTAIALGESENKLLSQVALAEHLQMPRETLRRWLHSLEDQGMISRDDGPVRLNPEKFWTDESVQKMRQLIVESGSALSKDT